MITDLLELDFTGLVPPLDTMLSDLRAWISWALMIGPLILLALGIYYLVSPPKEANHKAGFRSYYAMGSLTAWRYAQRLAGWTFGGIGLGLSIAMGIVCLVLIGAEAITVMNTAIVCLICQIAAMGIGYIVVSRIVASRFDADGNPRK